jgi:hypothetical protein
MKFTKRDGKMDWWVKFERITSIRSVIEVPNEDYFYGCGDYQLNEDETGIQDMATQATYQAVIFKMEKDGTVNWIQEIGGSNPVAGQPRQDRCYGLTYNPANGHVTSLLQVKAKALRA